jgi:hypothetical protein
MTRGTKGSRPGPGKMDWKREKERGVVARYCRVSVPNRARRARAAARRLARCWAWAALSVCPVSSLTRYLIAELAIGCRQLDRLYSALLRIPATCDRLCCPPSSSPPPPPHSFRRLHLHLHLHLPAMSFFGFDASLPRDRGHQTSAPGFGQHDAFAALSGGAAADDDDAYVGPLCTLCTRAPACSLPPASTSKRRTTA